MKYSSSTAAVRAAAVIVAIGVVAACGDEPSVADRVTGRRRSPFALFGRDDMRAGLRFEALEAGARKESVKQFQCMPLWAAARSCSLPIEPGMLSAIVDREGRVIRLSVHTDGQVRGGQNVHNQLIFSEAVRDTRAAWDSIGSVIREEADGGVRQLRWLDPGRRWGAAVWYAGLRGAPVPPATRGLSDDELAMTLPESLGVSDMPAYALLMQLRPASPSSKPRTVTASGTRPPAPRPPNGEQALTMMRSDLRELTIAQEGVLHGIGRYETTMARLRVQPSPGVRLELLHATFDGWAAIATHPILPGRSCVVYAGYVGAPPQTRKESRRAPAQGAVVCDTL